MRHVAERLYWTTDHDILALAHADTRGTMPLIPEGMRSLAERGSTFNRGHDDAPRRDGCRRGLRHRTGEPSPTRDGRGTLEVYFTIVLLGRGALFIFELKRYDAPEMMALMADVRSTGTAWRGEQTIISTEGPEPDRKGKILGGTGEFDGATGQMFQTMTFRETRPSGPPLVESCETLMSNLAAT